MFKPIIAAAALTIAACTPALASLNSACATVAEHAWAAAEARDRGETAQQHIANYMARPWIEGYERESVIATTQIAYGVGADFGPEKLADEARTACLINGAAMGF